LSRIGNTAKSFIVPWQRCAAISVTKDSGGGAYGSDSGLGKRGVDRDRGGGGGAVVEVAFVVEAVSRAWEERPRGIGRSTECAVACGCDLAMVAHGLEGIVQGEVGSLCLVPGDARMHGGGAGRDGEQGCEAQHLGFDCGFGDAPLIHAHVGSNARDEGVDGAAGCAFPVRNGGCLCALQFVDELERWRDQMRNWARSDIQAWRSVRAQMWMLSSCESQSSYRVEAMVRRQWRHIESQVPSLLLLCWKLRVYGGN
jgi:hypothetical protein